MIPIKTYPPLFTLKEVAKDIWTVDGPAIEMDFGLFTVPFSTRMTVIRLENGDLWCHSPIEPDSKLLDELDAVGKLTYLIAPNKLHYAHVQAWKNIYPDAKVWLAPGVAERAKGQNIPLPEGQELTETAPDIWAETIDQSVFKGSRAIEEVVFFHWPSQTLILTDLIENIETAHLQCHHRLLYKIGDNTYPNGKTPRDLRLTFLGRKKEAQASFQKLLSWQPQNIIISHGPCFFNNAIAELKRAFEWVG